MKETTIRRAKLKIIIELPDPDDGINLVSVESLEPQPSGFRMSDEDAFRDEFDRRGEELLWDDRPPTGSSKVEVIGILRWEYIDAIANDEYWFLDFDTETVNEIAKT